MLLEFISTSLLEQHKLRCEGAQAALASVRRQIRRYNRSPFGPDAVRLRLCAGVRHAGNCEMVGIRPSNLARWFPDVLLLPPLRSPRPAFRNHCDVALRDPG